MRAFYAASIMTSLLADQPPSLDSTLYGYVEENDLLVTDIGLQPVPEEFLIHCNCINVHLSGAFATRVNFLAAPIVNVRAQ